MGPACEITGGWAYRLPAPRSVTGLFNHSFVQRSMFPSNELTDSHPASVKQDEIKQNTKCSPSAEPGMAITGVLLLLLLFFFGGKY